MPLISIVVPGSVDSEEIWIHHADDRAVDISLVLVVTFANCRQYRRTNRPALAFLKGMGANHSHDIPPLAPSGSSPASDSKCDEPPIFPNPTGNEYDAIDKLQAELPSIIDEESQQQVDDYKQACDNGKGPVRWIANA